MPSMRLLDYFIYVVRTPSRSIEEGQFSKVDFVLTLSCYFSLPLFL